MFYISIFLPISMSWAGFSDFHESSTLYLDILSICPYIDGP